MKWCVNLTDQYGPNYRIRTELLFPIFNLNSYYTNPQGLFTQLFFSISFLRRLPDTALKVTS